MRVLVSSTLPISAQTAWSLVRKSSTLLYVTKGLLGFRALDASLPSVWKEGKTERLRILLFNVIPAWEHRIKFQEISDSDWKLLTYESGGVINTWNHLITIKMQTNQSCTYTDEVEIKAGVFTVFVYLYAQIFYRYRQRRWKRLARQCDKVT